MYFLDCSAPHQQRVCAGVGDGGKGGEAAEGGGEAATEAGKAEAGTLATHTRRRGRLVGKRGRLCVFKQTRQEIIPIFY